MKRRHHPLYAVDIIPRLYAFQGLHALGTESVIILQAKNPRRRVIDALEDVGYLIQMPLAMHVLYIAGNSLSFIMVPCLSKNPLQVQFLGILDLFETSTGAAGKSAP